MVYIEATVMITNKKFQPRHFLLQVHRNTSYNELVQGEERLRRDVDQRAEALKSLVHQNFDRFVSAKNTIDHVYDEMKSKQLNQQQDYGTIDIQKALEGKIIQKEEKQMVDIQKKKKLPITEQSKSMDPWLSEDSVWKRSRAHFICCRDIDFYSICLIA